MTRAAEFHQGLVVGKFSPLHLGHALLIERAIAHCDEVLVISYTVPEYPRCGRANRARWLAELFPGVRALVIDQAELDRLCDGRGLERRSIPHNDEPADNHRHFVGWLCGSLLETTVDAVFTSEDYGDGFATALTSYFASRGYDLQVAHVCVDRDRVQVPMSGTAGRADPHAARAALPAAVYADFVQRVAILGAESSGKTTLSRALAERFATAAVPEYGREHWQARHGALTFEDMLQIGQVQADLEDAAARRAQRWLFCDSTPFSSVFYSQHNFGRVDARLVALARRPYDHVFLCAPDFGFVQDGTRAGRAFSERQHQWHLEELARRRVACHVLSGSLAERIAQAEAILTGSAPSESQLVQGADADMPRGDSSTKGALAGHGVSTGGGGIFGQQVADGDT
jgi:NadR type nicotinamide-nucleotide adenylyltransferase